MSERVEQLLNAGNAASGRARGLWVTFILFGTYLIIAIGSTTHRQMLLEEPIVLPILGASLNLIDFYRFAPLLFLIYHFYMLVQLFLLARPLRRLDLYIEADVWPETVRRDLRSRADNFLITQLLVGGPHGILPGLFIRVAAWLTMVFAPVVLLLAFQIRFLPYHDVLTTWVHRGILIVDVSIVWLLWPAIASREGGLGGAVVAVFWKPWAGLYRTLHQTVKAAVASFRTGDYGEYFRVGFSGYESFRRVWRTFVQNLFWAAITLGLSRCVIGFSLLVATIPAEGIERWLLNHPLVTANDKGEKETETWPVDFWDLTERSGETDVSIWRLSEWQIWAEKRPRDRQVPVQAEPNMVWWPTAILFEGEPDQASSKVSSLFSRNLVLVDDIDLVKLNDKELENTERTLVLRGRDLRYARFDRADMRKADMFEANLAGAVLSETRLEHAKLEKAEMQGADLSLAEMQGADLRLAGMQGADLSWARMQGADLSWARMQGADLMEARMQGADLRWAGMQGADLRWGGLWMAVAEGTNLEWADTRAANNEGPFADSDLLKRKETIDAWLDAIPEGTARDHASDRLDTLRDPSRGPAECRAWLCAQNLTPPEDWNDTAETGLGNYLGELGCRADNAPHVARGLLRRMALERNPILGSSEKRAHHTIAASRLADTANCPGAKGLTDEELAKLRAIADGKE